MTGGRRALLLATTVVTAAAATTVVATQMRHLTDEMLISESTAILHVSVKSVQSEWNAAHDQIWTTVELQVIERLKNDLPRNADGDLILRQLGGSIGDLTFMIVGQPEFITGEESILFLRDQPLGPFPLVGMRQGMLRITRDPVTGERTIPARAVTLDDISARIRGIAVRQQEEFERTVKEMQRQAGQEPTGPMLRLYTPGPIEDTATTGGGSR